MAAIKIQRLLLPQEEWQTWVKKLRPKFEYLWIKAGIEEAIKASTYEIKRDDELILSLASRLVFQDQHFCVPLGRSNNNIGRHKTLLGLFYSSGSVSNPLVNSEQKEAEEELIESTRIFNSSKARNVTHRPCTDELIIKSNQ